MPLLQVEPDRVEAPAMPKVECTMQRVRLPAQCQVPMPVPGPGAFRLLLVFQPSQRCRFFFLVEP